MSTSGIQGQILEVTVVACINLRDTEWISKQDPYVCIEYAKDEFRTRKCTGGGKNPLFQEKFLYTLIEGLRELKFSVWNSNTMKYDDFIGSGKVHLQKVLSTGFDDSTWPLVSKTGRHSGDLRLIMHYANANASPILHRSSVAEAIKEPHSIYSTVCSIRLDMPKVPEYSTPPPASAPPYPPASAPPYPPASAPPYPPASAPPYPPASAPPYPPSSAYLTSPPFSLYPHNPAPNPPKPYREASAYPQPYEASSAYPPQPYEVPFGYPLQPYYPPASSHSDPPPPQGELNTNTHGSARRNPEISSFAGLIRNDLGAWRCGSWEKWGWIPRVSRLKLGDMEGIAAGNLDSRAGMQPGPYSVRRKYVRTAEEIRKSTGFLWNDPLMTA